MGIFSNLISAATKTVLLPVAVVKDAVSVISGDEPDATKELIKSVEEDVSEAGEDISDAF